MSNIIHNKTDIKKDKLIQICSLLNLNLYDLIKNDPKFKYYIPDGICDTLVISLFKKVGIDDPREGSENILMNLINENKELFLSDSQNKTNEQFDKSDK